MSVRVSVAVIKTPRPNATWGEKDLLQSTVPDHSPSSKENRAGIGGRNLKQKARRNDCTWYSMASSAFLLLAFKQPALGWQDPL